MFYCKDSWKFIIDMGNSRSRVRIGVMWVINIITSVMILQRYSVKMNMKEYESSNLEKGNTWGRCLMWGVNVIASNLGIKRDIWMIIWVFNVVTSGIIICGIIICGGWVYKTKCKKGNMNKQTIKPKNWPIMGCQIEASLNFHRIHDWCHQFFSNENRTVELKFFTTRIYLTVDPASVEHILRTNFHNYPKGKSTREKMKDLLGDGIFNADGETWRKQRKIASVVFNGKNLRDLSILSFRKDSLCLLATLQSAAVIGNPIDLQDLLLSMTMDSISRVGFGIQGGRLYTMRRTFTSAYDKVNAMISKRFVNVWWKAHKIFRLSTEKVLLEELANLNSFTSQVIANRRAELVNLSSNTICSKEKGDLLSRLMDIGGKSSTEKDLRDSIMNFMIAGRDTTAVTMSWFIYNICKKQEVADKIYQEIKGVICCEKSPKVCLATFKEVADCLTFEALSCMHYLHAALTETLRLHPAVARDTKVAIHDDILPDGTRIKKGDHVAYVPYSMGRMEFLWGSDALEFKPERWLKDGQFNQVSPFKFTSFQAGPRMCIGKDWAYLQMKMAMSLLIYFFEFKLVPDQVVRYQVMMVLAIANGLQVTVHNRTTH